MATINITDNFGAVINAELDPASSFAKYLKSPKALIGTLRNGRPLQDLRIEDDPFQSQTVGISFTDPISLGATGIQLTIKPSSTGTISIDKGNSLFDAETDPFREAVPNLPQHGYLGATLSAELNLTLTNTMTDLQFGFVAGTTISLTNYQLCVLSDPVLPAVERLLEKFTIPGDLEDIRNLEEHAIVAVVGTGSLRFSAQANLFTAANPLATINAPFVPIKVAQGGGVTISGVYTLSGAYQLRIQRLNGQRFRLGYLKKRTGQMEVNVQVQINTNVSVGSFDLVKSLLQAVSTDAVPDKDTFHQAGLTDDQLNTIATALKAGIERSLDLSLSGELDRLEASSTAFSYDIDASLLDDAGRQAIHDALDGDLTGVESAVHSGITRHISVFDILCQGSHILRVNLLGIYTHASVTTLLQKGTIIVDRESGEITITDQAGADRIQFTADHFAKDGAKLRQVLAESFLLTAVYRGSGGVLAGPVLASHYWFFELHQKTNWQQFNDFFTIAQALRVFSDTERSNAINRLSDTTAFGRSTLFIDASYNDALCKCMFVDTSGQPRTESDYEAVGRRAMLLLIPGGNPITDARRLPLIDDPLWTSMKELGQPGFPTLLGSKGFNANQLADITSDYTLITWWATSMHRMGETLAQVLAFLAVNPEVDRENDTFKQLRTTLEKTMASVVSNTQAQFGQPWGILALDIASTQVATTSFRLISTRFSLELTRQEAIGKGV